MRQGPGAAFGGSVLRYSSVGWLSLGLGQAVGLASVLVVVRFLGPGAFGRLSLLLFFSVLLNFLVGLSAQPGTMWRVFGAGDEDEGDPGEAPPEASTKRTLGTGIALVVLVGAIAVAVSLALAGPISEALFGHERHTGLLGWAAAAGSLGALYRLASMTVWMERRPRTFLRLSLANSLLTVAAVVALVVSGWGVEGAIIGVAIGAGLSSLLALIALRRSFQPSFEPKEASVIVQRAPKRAVVLGSFWTIDYMSIFVLSRFVSSGELGVFHFATRFAMAFAFGATAARLALRPLMRSAAFGALEDEYGGSYVRGTVVSYFALAAIGLTLVAALAAPIIVSLAPAGYAAAAALIPLVAVAQIAPTAFKVLNASVTFRGNKRRAFIRCVVITAVTFVPLAFMLVPLLGVVGAPLAMLLAFAGPFAYFLRRSQTGRDPLLAPWQPLALSALAAAALGLSYWALPLSGAGLHLALAVALLGAWVGITLLVGAVPHGDRPGLVTAFRTAVRGDGAAFEVEPALRGLGPNERAALRLAVVERRAPEQVAPFLGGDPAEASERLVGVLRRAISQGGGAQRAATEDDREIGRCLFPGGPMASRDATARRLVRSGRVEADDLHGLEAAILILARAPRRLWLDDGAPAGDQGRSLARAPG